MHAHGANQRWWVEPPQPDESIDSVFHRVAAVYKHGVSLQEQGWFVEVLGTRGMEEDPFQIRDVKKLADLLGVSGSVIRRTLLTESPRVLAPGQRRAFCPQCWREDDQKGRPRYLRRAWAGVLTVSCADHKLPLHPLANLRELCGSGIPWIDLPIGEHDHWLLDTIDEFGSTTLAGRIDLTERLAVPHRQHAAMS